MLTEMIAHQRSIQTPPDIEGIPFGRVLWPWVSVARRHLRERSGVKLALLTERAIFSLEKALVLQWSTLCAPAFVLQMRIAGLQGKSYEEFVTSSLLTHEGLQEFFVEYRELALRVEEILVFWIENSSLFLERLHRDILLLTTTFQGLEGPIEQLDPYLGDFHCGRQGVHRLIFSSGVSILYKPKSLAVVSAFQELLEELNRWGMEPPLRSYRVLARGDYGWEEWIEHAPCSSEKGVVDFFERAGALLSLLYLLSGSDAHYENLIACGDCPILIDLETLFHPTLRLIRPEESEQERNFHVLLSTGMLPMLQSSHLGDPGIDISALGAEGDQGFVSARVSWKEAHTSQMQALYKKQQLTLKTHRAIYEGTPVSAREHVEAIVDGFTRAYQLIFHYRKQFLQRVAQLADHPVRCIVRPTHLYGRFLERMSDPVNLLHPDLCGQELAKLEQIFPAKARLLYGPVAEEERGAICQGDVPYFFSLPKERRLYAGGRVLLEEAMSRSSYDEVCTRIEKMCGGKLQVLQGLIRESFRARHTPLDHHTEGGVIEQLKEVAPLTNREILTAAEEIGRCLCEQSFSAEDGGMGWIGLEASPLEGRWNLRILSDSLYAGRSGIALFFAALSRFSKNRCWQEAALRILDPIVCQVEQGDGKRLMALWGTGGMSGAGGVIYALQKTGSLLNCPSYLAAAKDLIASIDAEAIVEDRESDILGGNGGLGLALLSFYQETKDPLAKQKAEMCAACIVGRAMKQERGVAWQTMEGKPPLAGFSHGAGGIGYALFLLGHSLQNKEWMDCAREAFAFERSVFSHQSGNWPDFRYVPPIYLSQWCHGAAGIGLSRLSLWNLSREEPFRQEVESAKEATKKALHGSMADLCCGGAGQLIFLLQAERNLSYEEKDSRRYARLLADKHLSLSSPSLMKGSAGIGYALLSLLDEEGKLPNVLLIQ